LTNEGAINTDENKRLIRCFWVDLIAKKAYSYFGDVAIFDTTYNTNHYRMIFASIVRRCQSSWSNHYFWMCVFER
jgi:hypothetical protein